MKDCFIICPIGEEGSETRKRSDQLLKYVFTPVLQKNQFNPIRADQIPKPGMITSQIINLILDSPLVIADLTEGNPNVFYELAIRHAIRKPFIHIVEKGEKIPFDIYGIRTVQIDTKNLDSIEAAKQMLDKQIEEINLGHVPDSPFSTASKVKLIQKDNKIVEELLDKVNKVIGFGWNSIDDIADKIDDLERKIDDSTQTIINQFDK